MFDANSLSPFRRKNNGFIIPSYHYNKSKINNEYKEDDDLVSINESKVQSDHISSIEKNDDKKSFKNDYKVENITNSSKNNYVGVSKYSLSSIKIEKEAKQKLTDEKSSIEKLNDKFSIADITAWRVIFWFCSGKLEQIYTDVCCSDADYGDRPYYEIIEVEE